MNAPYIDDVPYVACFHPELGPVSMAYAALLAGVVPPDPRRAFVACDLGCGSGLTLCALAAALPHGQFVGVDLLAEHVEAARALAEAAGLDNVRFVHGDLCALPEDALPATIDFVTLHGVWSWVAPEVREAVLAIVDARLRPGGLFFVSYNALPGWAPLQPLRDAMQLFAASHPGSSVEKARHALSVLRRLRDEGAPYFATVAAASNMLDQLCESDVSYVAHEMLNPNWHTTYVHELASKLAERDLHFVATLPLHLNEPRFSVQEGLLDLVSAAAHPLLAELTRDLLTHETFREDIFVRGAPRAEDEEVAQQLATWCHGTWLPRSALGQPRVFQRRTVTFAPALFAPVCDAVCAGADTLEGLCRQRNTLAALPLEEVRQRLLALQMAEQAAPFVQATRRPPARAGVERIAVHGGFNRASLDRLLWSGPRVVLASAAAGQPFEVPFVDGLVMQGLAEVGRSGFVDWAQAAMVHRGRVPDADGATTGLEVLRTRLTEAVDRFLAVHLPVLEEHGIVGVLEVG